MAHEKELAQIDFGERILLLPQCLRPSETCPAKFSKLGLSCPDDCTETCVIRFLRQEALSLGYGGVCVAAGGKMALKFVRENGAKGIVAVACPEELKMGVEAVEEMDEYRDNAPVIVIVPLTEDGCVDTEVDTDLVIKALNLRS